MRRGDHGKSQNLRYHKCKDARQAMEAGASFLGLNFYQRSPRYILLREPQSES